MVNYLKHDGLKALINILFEKLSFFWARITRLTYLFIKNVYFKRSISRAHQLFLCISKKNYRNWEVVPKTTLAHFVLPILINKF